jgi:hypothetical protein
MKTNPFSFGSIEHYIKVIPLVQYDKHLWRKVANIVNNVRRQMHPWPFVDKSLQFKEAKKYVEMALNDTKLPDNIKEALRDGLTNEFNFEF